MPRRPVAGRFSHWKVVPARERQFWMVISIESSDVNRQHRARIAVWEARGGEALG
jgi:hypothetical protein